MSAAMKKRYAGQTEQERVARRRQALVDTAQALIADDGWRQLSIDRLCQQAGLHKRYFYESFPDMEALAIAVVDDLVGGLFRAIGDIEDRARSIPEFTHAVITALVNHLADGPHRARILFGELLTNEAVAAHRQNAIRRIEGTVVARASLVHGRNAARNPLATLTASMLVGGTGQVILDWLDGNIPMSRKKLAEDLSQLWLITGEGVVDYAKKQGPATAKRKRAPSQ